MQTQIKFQFIMIMKGLLILLGLFLTSNIYGESCNFIGLQIPNAPCNAVGWQVEPGTNGKSMMNINECSSNPVVFQLVDQQGNNMTDKNNNKLLTKCNSNRGIKTINGNWDSFCGGSDTRGICPAPARTTNNPVSQAGEIPCKCVDGTWNANTFGCTFEMNTDQYCIAGNGAKITAKPVVTNMQEMINVCVKGNSPVTSVFKDKGGNILKNNKGDTLYVECNKNSRWLNTLNGLRDSDCGGNKTPPSCDAPVSLVFTRYHNGKELQKDPSGGLFADKVEYCKGDETKIRVEIKDKNGKGIATKFTINRTVDLNNGVKTDNDKGENQTNSDGVYEYSMKVTEANCKAMEGRYRHEYASVGNLKDGGFVYGVNCAINCNQKYETKLKYTIQKNGKEIDANGTSTFCKSDTLTEKFDYKLIVGSTEYTKLSGKVLYVSSNNAKKDEMILDNKSSFSINTNINDFCNGKTNKFYYIALRPRIILSSEFDGARLDDYSLDENKRAIYKEYNYVIDCTNNCTQNNTISETPLNITLTGTNIILKWPKIDGADKYYLDVVSKEQYAYLKGQGGEDALGDKHPLVDRELFKNSIKEEGAYLKYILDANSIIGGLDYEFKITARDANLLPIGIIKNNFISPVFIDVNYEENGGTIVIRTPLKNPDYSLIINKTDFETDKFNITKFVKNKSGPLILDKSKATYDNYEAPFQDFNRYRIYFNKFGINLSPATTYSFELNATAGGKTLKYISLDKKTPLEPNKISVSNIKSDSFSFTFPINPNEVRYSSNSTFKTTIIIDIYSGSSLVKFLCPNTNSYNVYEISNCIDSKICTISTTNLKQENGTPLKLQSNTNYKIKLSTLKGDYYQDVKTAATTSAPATNIGTSTSNANGKLEVTNITANGFKLIRDGIFENNDGNMYYYLTILNTANNASLEKSLGRAYSPSCSTTMPCCDKTTKKCTFDVKNALPNTNYNITIKALDEKIVYSQDITTTVALFSAIPPAPVKNGLANPALITNPNISAPNSEDSSSVRKISLDPKLIENQNLANVDGINKLNDIIIDPTKIVYQEGTNAYSFNLTNQKNKDILVEITLDNPNNITLDLMSFIIKQSEKKNFKITVNSMNQVKETIKISIYDLLDFNKENPQETKIDIVKDSISKVDTASLGKVIEVVQKLIDNCEKTTSKCTSQVESLNKVIALIKDEKKSNYTPAQRELIGGLVELILSQYTDYLKSKNINSSQGNINSNNENTKLISSSNDIIKNYNKTKDIDIYYIDLPKSSQYYVYIPEFIRSANTSFGVTIESWTPSQGDAVFQKGYIGASNVYRISNNSTNGVKLQIDVGKNKKDISIVDGWNLISMQDKNKLPAQCKNGNKNCVLKYRSEGTNYVEDVQDESDGDIIWVGLNLPE